MNDNEIKNYLKIRGLAYNDKAIEEFKRLKHLAERKAMDREA